MTDSLINPRPRSLGPFEIGPLAFGCWRLTTDSVDDARALVETALDLGMNLVDNADVYGFDWGGSGFGANEELLGRVLASAPGLRERMVLSTKGGILPPVPYDSSAAYLEAACDASLARLQTDVIDVYQIHRPDMLTHPAEVAATLASLREKGKIREVGISNHTPAQHEALAAHLPFPLVSTQPEYSPAVLDPLRDGTFDLCMRDGVVPLAWSPLGGGRLLSGDGVRPELIATLAELAERERVDRAAICIAFVLAHPSAPVAILGTQTPARLEAATAALGVTLTREDVYRVIQDSEGVPLP
ncbi:MAG: oxidoreductase [Acidimicrobiales bacterium]|nr:MAG: oxidoreductase [Acidimicrobiales bacterium]